jgi:hypothetical protein
VLADTETGPPRPSPVRRLVGAFLAVLAAFELVAVVLGTWNPWRFVRLEQHFSDPFFGLLMVNVLVLAAFWLLAPVRSEAAQQGRHMTRWLLIVALVPVVISYGLFHRIFGVATREVAHSPSGERRVAFVTHDEDRQLRVWAGNWLTLRDLGRIGAPCGDAATARFNSEDLIHVTSVYGDFDVRLDHRTGRPLNTGPATCSG